MYERFNIWNNYGMCQYHYHLIDCLLIITLSIEHTIRHFYPCQFFFHSSFKIQLNQQVLKWFILGVCVLYQPVLMVSVPYYSMMVTTTKVIKERCVHVFKNVNQVSIQANLMPFVWYGDDNIEEWIANGSVMFCTMIYDASIYGRTSHHTRMAFDYEATCCYRLLLPNLWLDLFISNCMLLSSSIRSKHEWADGKMVEWMDGWMVD